MPAPSPTRSTQSGAPPCAHHAGQSATWYCRACQAALCTECVRVYSAHDMDFASCKACGGKCDAVIHNASTSRDGFLAQTFKEERERRENHRRDFIATPILLALAWLLHAALLTAADGPVIGILSAAGWLLAGTLAASMGLLALDYLAGVGFDPPGPTVLKLAAAVTAAHAARTLALAFLAPDVPSGGFVMSALGAIHAAFIMGVCLLLIPFLIFTTAVTTLFDMDGFDSTITITTLLLITSLLYALLKVAGLPG